MKKSKKLFNSEEVASIEATIAEVEKLTSAELVPVIASRSGRYDRAEGLFGILFSLVVFAGVWFFFQEIAPSTNSWNAAVSLNFNLIVMLLVISLSYIGGIIIASRFPALCLPFIAKREMQEEVEKAARESFHTFKIRNTENSTGIMIYISLYEHMVHVVGDDAISAKLDQSDWDSLCAIIISGFKEKNPAKGMKNGILSCGVFLKKYFPSTDNDSNELPNTLNFID